MSFIYVYTTARLHIPAPLYANPVPIESHEFFTALA